MVGIIETSDYNAAEQIHDRYVSELVPFFAEDLHLLVLNALSLEDHRDHR